MIEVENKKKELLYWIKKIGLTQAKFAERVFYYMNDSDNEEEIKSFKSKFDKAMQRDSTKIELIESYLDILYEQDEFIKLGYIKPKNHFKDEFDIDFNNRMKEISQSITEGISNNDL
jgi:hypothetical protein